MSNRVCWVPGAAEMHVFEAKVRGDERLVSWRNAQDGAVVPDGSFDRTCRLNAPSDAFDQRSFCEGHAITIAEGCAMEV